ncbi:MAG: AmpG family muropeptide MFS transporter [Magnetococcales bacterium]|nr:AmpG family muropeptide MFS transporter [Magnetococcales bacterium]
MWTPWQTTLTLYGHPRVVAIFFLGFSSGLPLALTFGTLSLWLMEAGIAKSTIGLFALASAPYTVKFLWSPLLDRLPIPGVTDRWGQRRGWALCIQVLLAMAIFGLGCANPAHDPRLTALFALLVAFLSASQDIVIDAYRVEILEKSQYGAGAAMIVLGYRVGMLVSGAGALYLATFFGWLVTYTVMAVCMGIGIATVLLNPEPERPPEPESRQRELKIDAFFADHFTGQGWMVTLIRWISVAVVAPLADFLTRRGWFAILMLILLYKLGEALAGVMSGPFYIDLHFSKIEIANMSKIFGLLATLVGSLLGGLVVHRFGIMKALLYCGFLQMASTLMFVWLAYAGRDITVLGISIAIENLSGGMGTAALVAYLSSLCHVSYTATQYALLSSFMAFGRTVLASWGGFLAERMSWSHFFLLTTAAALPGMLLLLWMLWRFPQEEAVRSGERPDP